MRIATCFLRVAFAGLTLMPLLEANTISYGFTVTATSGPLNGTVASGTFSYDSSSIVLGGLKANAGLLTALNFIWDGITYNKNTANTGSMNFDASGNLISYQFGTNCGPGYCGVQSGLEEFKVLGPFGPNSEYTESGVSGIFSGTVSTSQASTAPEPSTFVFLSAGLLGLTLAAVRRRSLGLRKL